MLEGTISTHSDTGITQLLTVPQVAKALNISRSLAYRLTQNGEIPCVRFGGSVRVRPEDVQRFIQANLSC